MTIIVTTATYTVRGYEQRTQLRRAKRLTMRGAERIIREQQPEAIVTMVEYAHERGPKDV